MKSFIREEKALKGSKQGFGNKEYFCFRAELSITFHLSFSEDGIIIIIPPPGLNLSPISNFCSKNFPASHFSHPRWQQFLFKYLPAYNQRPAMQQTQFLRICILVNVKVKNENPLVFNFQLKAMFFY